MNMRTLRWTIIGMAVVVIVALLIFYIQKSIAPTITMEGPHLFYNKGALYNLTLKMHGGKIIEDTTRVQKEALIDKKFKVKIPDEKQSFYVTIEENPQIPRSKYPVPENMIVLSDIEGDFDYLKSILIGNKVINHEYEWVYGNGHLVILGDLFDRGKYVTECLWLIYHLEQEAKKNGGQVHFIIGNHEIMTLQGDHRYVVKKYRRFAKKLNCEYKDFYGPHTVLGQWLRTKNAIEVIGDCMMVHGGISTELAQSDLSIDTINQIVRKHMDVPLKNYLDPKTNLVMGSKGPLWYRGFVEKISSAGEVDQVLDRFKIKSIVIGHTVMEEVTSLYNQRIFVVDADRINNQYTALLIENGIPYKIDSNSSRTKL